MHYVPSLLEIIALVFLHTWFVWAPLLAVWIAIGWRRWHWGWTVLGAPLVAFLGMVLAVYLISALQA